METSKSTRNVILGSKEQKISSIALKELKSKMRYLYERKKKRVNRKMKNAFFKARTKPKSIELFLILFFVNTVQQIRVFSTTGNFFIRAW